MNKVDFKPKRKTPARTERECSAYALRHGPNKELCPAFGKTCYKCNGKNHCEMQIIKKKEGADCHNTTI